MDQADLDAIGEDVHEFFDQVCTVWHANSQLGAFDCMLVPQFGGGGSPVAQGASNADLSRWDIYLMPEAMPAIREGNRIETTTGLILGIVGSDVGKSLNAVTQVIGAKQISGAPPVDIILARWDQAQRKFVPLPPQEFQVVVEGDQPRVTVGADGKTRTEYDGTLIGALSVDVLPNDRFTYDSMPGVVKNVTRSDRTEATMTLTQVV